MREQLDKSTSLVTYWKREAERLQAEVAERTADLALVTLQRQELTAEVKRWRGSSGGPRAIERAEKAEAELATSEHERVAAEQRVCELEHDLAVSRMCSTCCGTPHASGLPCICGGTNSREEEVKGLRLAAMKAEDRNPSYTIPISAKQSAGRTYEILAQHLAFRANQLRKLGLTFAADELTVMQKKCSDAMEDIANDVQGMYFGSRYIIGKNDAETLAAHAKEAAGR